MKTKKYLIPLIIVLLIAPLLIVTSSFSGYSKRVARVIDGDTIVLENGERIRYIGIDTPETKHPSKPVEYYGKEATEANRKLVEDKTVRLEFDAQERDKYGRLLAYVYVDTIFVNAELVRQGYAKVSTYPPNVKYQDVFLELEHEAREKRRGLWAKEISSSNPIHKYLWVSVGQENFRSSPNGKKIGLLLRNTKVEKIEKRGNWVKVQVAGWIWAPSLGLEKVYAPSKKATPKRRAPPRYCASRNSDVFHYCWCHYVRKIKSSNLITFRTREEAIHSGRRPCKKCKP